MNPLSHQYRLRPAFLVLLLVAGLLSCQPWESARESCIRVRALRGLCGQMVFQLQRPDDFWLGENAGGESHVFLGILECGAEVVASSILYIQLNPPDSRHNCAVCMAAMAYDGAKRYSVRVMPACSQPEP
ncbi:MAG: hypothetical protein MUC38_02555 [Cyclobacteriaceae bacterium]|jgi:hypothetical protein|nr:hypothetical protein [Cyclobacteriaceae bacterium]